MFLYVFVYMLCFFCSFLDFSFMYRCLKPSQDLQMLLTVRIRMKNDNNFNKSNCSNRDNINGSFFFIVGLNKSKQQLKSCMYILT